MKIIITGGAGFVGSNLAIFLKRKYSDYEIISIDNLKRRGSELNLQRLREYGIQFFHADVRCKEDLMEFGKFDIMIDSAAEPSVLAGINSSLESVINSNLMGTINCLEWAKRYKAGIIFLSTSRVYPIQAIENLNYIETETRFELSSFQTVAGVSRLGISESFPLKGYRSIYGTTKLASEIFIEEYKSLYGIKTIINRCGVITGPWQMGKIDQGFVVFWLARHLWKQKLAYIGYGGLGKQTRDILHILDLFELIDFQIHNIDSLNGELFNVGGGVEISISLCELTNLCREITGNTIEIEKILKHRPADVKYYITDNSFVHAKTGWKPSISVKQILHEIFDWLVSNENKLKPYLG